MTLQEKLNLLQKFFEIQPQEFNTYLLYDYYQIVEKIQQFSTPSELSDYLFELKMQYYKKLLVNWDIFCLNLDAEIQEFALLYKQQILRELAFKSPVELNRELQELFLSNHK